MVKKRFSPLNQADFEQIHAFLEHTIGQKITLPNLNKDKKSDIYCFSSCDPKIKNFREQFHLHLRIQNRSRYEKPYLNIKYLRVPQSMRRQKIGSKIVNFLIELIREKDFGGIDLVAKNRSAFLFWQRVGFKVLHGALLEYKFSDKVKTTKNRQLQDNKQSSGWTGLPSFLQNLATFYQKLKTS